MTWKLNLTEISLIISQILTNWMIESVTDFLLIN